MSVAANAILKVSPDELKAKADQINSVISAMESYMSNMITTMQTINENWQSTAGDAFYEKAQILIQEIKESIEHLRMYVEDLVQASAKYAEIEEQLSANVNGLDDPSSIFNS